MAATRGASQVPAAGAAGPAAPRFENVAAASGLRFVHQHSPTPDKHYVESAPGGLAVLDYDNDGKPDIFFTNGAVTPSLEKASPQYANRLFRNEGGLRFTDVTDAAGVSGAGYAMGAAAADYDNDGDVDLFVAGVRHNQLLRNTGAGRFEDVTAAAGIASGDWAVGGVWIDYDEDGRLDLLVVNYVRWSPGTSRYCGDQARGIRTYCHPRFFQGLPNRLYRNAGSGRFEDVSERAGIAKHVGKGMSGALADYDHDGHLDVFVANDTVPNFLFHNKGDGTFEETALVAGVAVPSSGRPVSGMGSDFQDYDNDGWEDLHLTALTGETFPLFRNDRAGGFVEATVSSGLAAPTTKYGGWCTVFADVNNDGWKDLFNANSHANDRIGETEVSTWKQPNTLFLNDARGRFRDAGEAAGLSSSPAVHRGCAIADLDADGRLDIVVLTLGSNAELWHNASASHSRWLAVKLVGTRSNRDGIGARIRVGNQVRTMTTAMGYASSVHQALHFGVGDTAIVDKLVVEWPTGATQVVEKVETNQTVVVKEP